MAAPPTPASPPPPTSLLDYTLRTAPLHVVYGTLASAGLGAAAGAATGVIRDRPAIPSAFTTAVRTGVFSFTFFSLREYALIPLLTQLELHPSPLPSPPDAHPPNPHTANLLPTSLSALLAGSAFSAYQRPAPVSLHLRAGLTLAVGCAVLQSLVNEADLLRLRLLLRGEERARQKRFEATLTTSHGPTAAAAATGGSQLLSAGATREEAPLPRITSDLTHQVATTSTSALTASDPGRETFSERSDRLFASLWQWTKNRAGALSPVSKLDEAEYVRRLQERLDGVESERERTRNEREELERMRERLRERQRVREQQEEGEASAAAAKVQR